MKTHTRRRVSIITTYAVRSVLGGALITAGFVAALMGLRLYGLLGLLAGLLLGGVGLLLHNARDRWSGHHP
jgi:hypothetical protein